MDLDYLTEDAIVNIVKNQEKYPNIRTFVQFKYSAKPLPEWKSFGYTASGEWGCTYRFEANAATLNPMYKKDTNTARKPFLLTADMKKGVNTYKMYEAQNLADYIKWYFKQVPDAKVFVLAFGDHGAAYSITTDYDKSKAAAQAPTRRGMLYDDNIEDEPCMTPAEMATAINAAGKKIDLVFFDCCMMNNLEVLGELQGTGLVDYAFASGHTVTASPLDMLCDDLSKGYNKGNWVDGAKQYVYDIMDFMERQYLKDYDPLDLNKEIGTTPIGLLLSTKLPGGPNG